MTTPVSQLRRDLADHLRAAVPIAVHAFSPDQINQNAAIVEITDVNWSAHRMIATVEVSVVTILRGDNRAADQRFNDLGHQAYTACLDFENWAHEPYGTTIDYTATDVPGEGADLAVATISGTVLVPYSDGRSLDYGSYVEAVRQLLVNEDISVLVAGESPPFTTLRYAGADGRDGRYEAAGVWCAVTPDTDIESYARRVWEICYASQIASPSPLSIELRSSPPGSVQIFDVASFVVRQAGGS